MRTFRAALPLFLNMLLLGPALLADEPGQKHFVVSAVLPCSRAEAWHLWTTSEGMQKSVGVQGSDIELKMAGKYEIYFSMSAPVGQRGSEGCSVLCYHPLEMFAFSWNAPPSIPELRNAGVKTHVVVRFASEAPDKTRVTLTHGGIGTGKAWDQYEQYFKNAWPRVLAHMASYAGKADRSTRNVLAADDLNPLIHEGIINAPADKVWHAYTTKEGLEAWMVAKAAFDLKVGGKMLTTYNKQATLGDERSIENTIRAYVPERMLCIQCTKTPKGFPFTERFTKAWTVLYFEPVNDKQTRFRCVGLNYGADEASAKLRSFFNAGNALTLQSLKKHCETK